MSAYDPKRTWARFTRVNSLYSALDRGLRPERKGYMGATRVFQSIGLNEMSACDPKRTLRIAMWIVPVLGEIVIGERCGLLSASQKRSTDARFWGNSVHA